MQVKEIFVGQKDNALFLVISGYDFANPSWLAKI